MIPQHAFSLPSATMNLHSYASSVISHPNFTDTELHIVAIDNLNKINIQNTM